MATSGSYDFSVTAANIIQAALEDLGKLQPGESVTTSDSTLCLQRLNFIAKMIQGNADMSQGFKVWTRQRIALFLAKGQQTYTIGPAATDSRATTQFGITTISALEAIGQTVISITSNTDTTNYPGTTVTMTSGDIVGLVLNDGTIQWTTISGTPAATMTIANALTVAANAGNKVYWFTSRAQRFPELEYAVLRNSDFIDVTLDVYTDVQQYEALPDKTADGDPISILVEPLRLNTRITTDYQPNDVTKQIILTVIYPAEDYDSSANDIAFPQEFFARLEWELALAVAPAFEVAWTQSMQTNYAKATAVSNQLNPQTTSAHFEPGKW